MAHTKAKGSTSLGRDSRAKRLGVKVFGGQKIKKGDIIIRQKGTKYRAGENVQYGKDWTIFAIADGVVRFKKQKIRKYTGRLEPATVVGVEVSK